MGKQENRLRAIGYKISSNPADIDEQALHSPELSDYFDYCMKNLLNNKKDFDSELKEFITKFPDAPQFMNYLSTYYSRMNDFQKAYEVNRELVKRHPDYLYGKLNLAHQFMSEGRVEQVPKILGDYMELGKLYPERKTFHIDEVMSFCTAALRYFIAIGNIEQAEMRVELMKKISPDSNSTKEAERSLFALIMEKAAERFEEESKKARTPVHVQKKVYEQKIEEPVFQNKEIGELYKYGFQIEPELMSKILSLPREQLIIDLRKVLIDSMERYDYFKDSLESNFHTHTFPIHALLLLTELRAEEALEEVLELLRQDGFFLEFWFSDLITEVPSFAIEACGNRSLDKLRDYMFEEGNDTYARSEVAVGVAHIAHNSPDRRREVIDWFNNVLKYFNNNTENEGLIDTSLVGFMLCEVLDLKAFELEPTVKKLYESGIVDMSVVGDHNDFLEDLYGKNKLPVREKFNFKKFYKDLAKSERTYEKETKRTSLIEDEEDREFGVKYDELPEMFRNIGRNEKCPCGSGLKYKKCHGKAYN